MTYYILFDFPPLIQKKIDKKSWRSEPSNKDEIYRIAEGKPIMPPEPATSYEEMKETFQKILQKKIDEKDEDQELVQLLIPTQRMVGYYKFFHDKEISANSLRNYGFANNGYFHIKYPRVFDYNDSGKRKHRGLIIDVEQFIEQIGLPEGVENEED